MPGLSILFRATGLSTLQQALRQGRSKIRNCLIILSLLNLQPLLYAQHIIPEQRITFERVALEPSYHEEMEACMTQDKDGFLWFGTHYGLYKYDRYRFTLYRYDPKKPTSLSDASVTSMYQDRSGIFWVGTMGGGLNRFITYRLWKNEKK